MEIKGASDEEYGHYRNNDKWYYNCQNLSKWRVCKSNQLAGVRLSTVYEHMNCYSRCLTASTPIERVSFFNEYISRRSWTGKAEKNGSTLSMTRKTMIRTITNIQSLIYDTKRCFRRFVNEVKGIVSERERVETKKKWDNLFLMIWKSFNQLRFQLKSFQLWRSCGKTESWLYDSCYTFKGIHILINQFNAILMTTTTYSQGYYPNKNNYMCCWFFFEQESPAKNKTGPVIFPKQESSVAHIFGYDVRLPFIGSHLGDLEKLNMYINYRAGEVR